MAKVFGPLMDTTVSDFYFGGKKDGGTKDGMFLKIVFNPVLGLYCLNGTTNW